MFSFIFSFETYCNYVAQAVLNSQSFCLSPQCSGIVDVCHHAQLKTCYKTCVSILYKMPCDLALPCLPHVILI